MSFQDLWAPTDQALASGTFDPQGSNYVAPFNSATLGPVQSDPASGVSDNPYYVPSFPGTSTSLDNYTAGMPGGSGIGSVPPGLQGRSFVPGSSGYQTNTTGGDLGLPGNVLSSLGMTQGTAQTLTGGSADIASYFNRGVVIILGFIFVAAGLWMFSSGVTVEGVLKK